MTVEYIEMLSHFLIKDQIFSTREKKATESTYVKLGHILFGHIYFSATPPQRATLF
jgi:hypothetical protein